jgi:hypothetical protein
MNDHPIAIFGKPNDEDTPKIPKCEVCGGYGYKHPQGGGSPMRCPSCLGDKRSRDPRHYKK